MGKCPRDPPYSLKTSGWNHCGILGGEPEAGSRHQGLWVQTDVGSSPSLFAGHPTSDSALLRLSAPADRECSHMRLCV